MGDGSVRCASWLALSGVSGGNREVLGGLPSGVIGAPGGASIGRMLNAGDGEGGMDGNRDVLLGGFSGDPVFSD